ncbi:MAG: hypothetical protein RLZZ428_1166 [Pseudomonadota bacterium]
MLKKIFIALLVSTAIYGETLQELIHIGLQQSTLIKKSDAEHTMTQMKHEESKVSQYGSFDLIGEFTHFNTPRTLIPMTPTSINLGVPITTTNDLYSTGIVYTVPLFTGFAQNYEIEIQKISTHIAMMKKTLTKEQLVYNIRTIYLSILALEEAIKAQHFYTKALQNFYIQIQYEVKLGKKAQIDLLNAKSSLVTSQSKEIVFKSNTNILYGSLASLVGIDQITHITPISIKVEKPNYTLDTILRDATSLSKIKLTDLQIDQAEKAIAKVSALQLPQVNLKGYTGKNYGKDETLNQWDNEYLWQIGLNLQWNIIDFGKRSLAKEQAKIAKMNALVDKDQALKDVKYALIEAIEKTKQSYELYHANNTQITLLNQNEMIEKVRYENGASTINDFLLAQSKTQIAKIQRIENKYQYQKNIYYISYLMETGMTDE